MCRHSYLQCTGPFIIFSVCYDVIEVIALFLTLHKIHDFFYEC